MTASLQPENQLVVFAKRFGLRRLEVCCNALHSNNKRFVKIITLFSVIILSSLFRPFFFNQSLEPAHVSGRPLGAPPL
jgi:hypothetical protein